MTAPVLPLLTAAQKRLLTVFRDHALNHGCPPTIEELAAQLGWTPGHCFRRLMQLRDAGWVYKHPTRHALVVRNPDDGSTD